jgi:hypothetical protein
MQNWLKLSLVFGIFGSFAVAILLIQSGASDRVIGVPIALLGFGAIVGAQEVASTLARPDVVRRVSLGTRTESSLRPFTLVLWGFGMLLVGLLHLFVF